MLGYPFSCGQGNSEGDPFIGALCAHGERLGFARRGEPRDDAGDP